MRRHVGRRPLLVLLVLVLLAMASAAAPGAGAGTDGTDDGRVDKVLVITAPALRWTDLAQHDLPNLERLLGEASVARLSLRTLGARTSIGEGYATIGAGNRASVGATDAGLALERNERFEEGFAFQVYERRTGEEATGALLQLAFPAIDRLNGRFLYGAEPGALGQALADADRTFGVVANADLGLALPADEPAAEEPSPDVPEGEEPDEDGDVVDPDEPAEEEPVEPEVVTDDADEEPDPDMTFVPADYGRAAALVAMDRSGQVAVGDVDRLLRRDAAAPYGVRYDTDAVVAAFADVWADVDGAVVELSDLDRADSYRREADREAAAELWAQALVHSDELVGRILAEVDDDTAVIVLTPAAPRAAESLGVFALSGVGEGGSLARSGATRRSGYVALTDVGPTILDLLGVEAPSSMTGTLISEGRSATVDDDLFAEFARSTQEAIFRNKAVGPVSAVFVIAQIVAYALAAVAVSRRRRWVGPVSFLALVILATPPIAFGIGLAHVDGGPVLPYLLAIFAGAIVLAGAAEGVAHLVARRWPRTRALVAPLCLVASTWLVLVIDIVTGGWLQIDTVFGYSPIIAGRFAGFGNLAFALVAISAVVLACGGWALWCVARARTDGSAEAGRGVVVVMAVFLAATVVIDGAPAWGADVGGVLATVPAFAVLVLVAAGVAVSLRRGIVIGVATALTISLFAAVDLARPEEDRTHLGRLVARVTDTEGGGFGEVLERKINSNINILTSSIWTLTIPAALGLMVFLARRRTGFLRDLQEQVPGIRALLAGGLLVAILGFALNDSGVAVPAMMFAVLLPFLTYVLLRWDPARH